MNLEYFLTEHSSALRDARDKLESYRAIILNEKYTKIKPLDIFAITQTIIPIYNARYKYKLNLDYAGDDKFIDWYNIQLNAWITQVINKYKPDSAYQIPKISNLDLCCTQFCYYFMLVINANEIDNELLLRGIMICKDLNIYIERFKHYDDKIADNERDIDAGIYSPRGYLYRI